MTHFSEPSVELPQEVEAELFKSSNRQARQPSAVAQQGNSEGFFNNSLFKNGENRVVFIFKVLKIMST